MTPNVIDVNDCGGARPVFLAVRRVADAPRAFRTAQPLTPGSRGERLSATEAYKDAGYKGDRTAASRLATNVNVQARVRELRVMAAERTKVTIASLVQEAEEVRGLAVAERQLSAANTTIVTKAKLSGLWVDRSEVGEIDISRTSAGRRDGSRSAIEG